MGDAIVGDCSTEIRFIEQIGPAVVNLSSCQTNRLWRSEGTRTSRPFHAPRADESESVRVTSLPR